MDYIADKIVVQKNGPLTVHNYFKYFPNHEESQSVSERFFDTLLKLGLIDTWTKRDMVTGQTHIGWKYELH